MEKFWIFTFMSVDNLLDTDKRRRQFRSACRRPFLYPHRPIARPKPLWPLSCNCSHCRIFLYFGSNHRLCNWCRLRSGSWHRTLCVLCFERLQRRDRDRGENLQHWQWLVWRARENWETQDWFGCWLFKLTVIVLRWLRTFCSLVSSK